MDDQAILQRAFRAHHNTCRRRGAVYMQPGSRASRVVTHAGTHYAVLANGCGGPDETLAVYRVDGDPRNDYRLVGLRDWPAPVVE